MATLATLYVNLTARTASFDSAMARTEKSMARLSRRTTSIGRGITMGLSLPLLAMGYTAVKAAIDFESAWTGVEKTVDGTTAQLAALQSGIRDMAKTIPASTTEIAKVAEAAGQLGIETGSILKFSSTMIDLGNTTNMSADTAATALARLANITQMPQDQFGRLGATVVDLGNNLATTEAEIVEMGLRLAGAGKQLGLQEHQILALAGALSSVGVEAQAGGAAISKSMINIASAVDKGGRKLEIFSAVAGMTAAEFKQRFKTDAADATVAFIEGLKRLADSGRSVFPVLDALGMGETRVRDALLRASGAGDLFRRSLEIGSTAWAANTALVNEAEKRYATMASRMKTLWQRAWDVAITLGQALMPVLNSAMSSVEKFVPHIERLIKSFAELSPRTQNVILAIAGIIVVVGPAIMVFGMLATAVTALIPVFALVAGAILT
ncbi:MAG: phage tail tape measure protein, partial [bacterium]